MSMGYILLRLEKIMIVGGLMYTLKVKEIAESRHIGIAKLSRLADVSIISVRKMWRNPNYKPGLDTLEKIAKALGVRVEDLLEYTPDEEE